MAEYNGGFYSYPDRVTKKIFFRAESRYTKTVTIKSGQVIKALSFLETDANGKCIAHGGIVESATVVFGTALTSGQTMILGGLTWTAGSAGTTVAQLATVFSGLADGVTAATATAALSVASTVGTFTAGSLSGYNTTYITTGKVRFDATVTGNVTDLAATGTGTGATVTVIQGGGTFNKIAGVLLFDVDASAGDVDATAYQEGSFWASALTWAVDPAIDVVTKVDGTTVAVTAYNTGASNNLLKQKFVEGTEFEPLGFLSAGEQL